MPSALKVRVMYEKAPEILMLMERKTGDSNYARAPAPFFTL